jgi:hypothetical protein
VLTFLGPLRALLLLVVTQTPPTGALGTLYLTPETFNVPVGQGLRLRVLSGQADRAELLPWPQERIGGFFINTGNTRHNRATIGPSSDDPRAAEVRIDRPGVAVIALNTRPAVVELAAGELREFVRATSAADESLLKALPVAGTVRVRRIESASAIVRVTEPGGSRVFSAAATAKLGLRAEIQPLMDPTALSAGSDVAIRVFVDAVQQPDVQVFATCVADGQRVSLRTDPVGSAHFALERAGVFRVEFHRLERLGGDPQADFNLYSGSLCFEVSAEGGGR